MTLREIQLYKLGIMEDIASICDKHGIKYILHYGTLLGAIRHAGYIPWDDDVDIAVSWRDLRKLIELINEEYSEKYFAQSIWTDRNYPLLWAQIRVNGTTSMPIEFCSHDIHWGMCIDVFALIAYEADEQKEQKIKKAVGFVESVLAKEYMDMINMEARGKRQRLINMIPHQVRHLIADALLKKYVREPKEDGLVSTLPDFQKVYKYSDVLVAEKHAFEGKQFSVPKGYENVLVTEYGDYMTLPPEEERGGHEQGLGKIINDVNKDYREYKAELIDRRRINNKR